MAMKRATFSFSLPMETLLQILGKSSDRLDIQVLGDEPRKLRKQANGEDVMKLLEDHRDETKKKRRTVAKNGIPNREFILEKLAAAPRKTMTQKELAAEFTKDGRNPRSMSPQIFVMVRDRKIERTADGGIRLK